MNDERYSMPERFVDTWAEIQAIPDCDISDPFRHVIRALKQEAIGLIGDALIRSVRITDQINRLKEDAAKAAAPEVPRG